jgi:hypothetical protein
MTLPVLKEADADIAPTLLTSQKTNLSVPISTFEVTDYEGLMLISPIVQVCRPHRAPPTILILDSIFEN